ncbi:MAG: hypothetical protein H0T42_09120 [Deltaproteobacteria bacterium]|nr:hypothetical protein [Deltaproteobacteria bacterium]
MARAKAKSKKPSKSAKPATKPSAGRTKKPASKRAAKPAKPTKRASSPRETPRTRAPTISVRDETPRTRAPTASPRPIHRTVLEPANELADPARAAELAALEAQAETLTDPDLLVALATQIDGLGMQLAYEISRHAHDEAHIAPLKPVLMRVPALYGRTLLRAAEKFDDQGSPRRAAYVLFEALRKAFDHDVITSVAGALSFVLEAHGQTTPAAKIRALLAERDEQRARGVERREVRTQFAAALETLRDRGVQWDALDDVADQFD